MHFPWHKQTLATEALNNRVNQPHFMALERPAPRSKLQYQAAVTSMGMRPLNGGC